MVAFATPLHNVARPERARRPWHRIGFGLALAAALLGPRVSGAEINVTTKPFADIAFHPEHRLPARTIALNDSQLSAEVSARIVAIAVRVGDAVKKGATLAALDARDFELNLRREQAKRDRLMARLDFARYQYERARSLEKSNAVSAELLSQRDSEARALAAEVSEQDGAVEQARLTVQRSVITAPFDGVVLERYADEGEIAAPGTPLLRLIDSTDLEVAAEVQPVDLESLEAATETWFDNGRTRFALKRRVVARAVDPATRGQQVRLVYENARPLPGTAGTLVWRSALMSAPAEFIVRRGNSLGLFIVDDGRTRFVTIPGATEGRPAVVSLPPTARVVIAGRHSVNDGDSVRE